MFGGYNILTEGIYLAINIPAITLATNIVCLMLIGKIYSKNIKQLLISILLIISITIGAEAIVMSLVNYNTIHIIQKNPMLNIEEMFFVKALLHIITLLVTQLKNIKLEYKLPMKYCLPLIIITTISIYIIILITNYRQTYVILRLSGAVGMVVINIAIVYLYNTVNQYSKAKTEKLLYQKESIYYQNQFEILKQSIEQDKKIKHDINNNLFAIDRLLENGNIEEAQSYISSIQEHYKVSKEISKTGVIIIDSILNYKLYNLEQAGTHCNLKVSVPNTINIDSFDIGIVLSNILDNAVEAIEQLPPSQRQLIINIEYTQQENLSISVKNTYNGKINLQQGIITTSKKDELNHGLGLNIVKSIAQKYGDYLKINYDQRWFEVSIIMVKKQP